MSAPHTVPFSLSTLRSHSIFVPPSSSSSSKLSAEDDWELVNKPELSDGPMGQKTSRMVLRDKDLFVAMSKEVRMMSLSSGEGWEVNNGMLGAYKTLTSPSLTFPILQIIPNQKGRLLAVVGHHQIVVLVLPKPSYSGAHSGEVECRSISIDEFQFSPSSTDSISKVSWHPWGEGGNSLWVLTTNGKLREYDILQPHDPVQTFNLLPEKTTSAKFTAVDPLSRIATSFAFSTGTTDFGPLMIYVLIANGDIYTMGPILPLRSEVPLRYLQGLKAYADGRLAQIQSSAVDVFGASEAGLGKATFQVQWVDAVIKQVKAAEEARRAKEEAEETPSRRSSLLGRSTRRDSDASSSKASRAVDGMVRIHPPHLTESGGPAPGAHRQLLRQGPAVFSPGPQEVGNDEEEEDQVATDIYVSVASTEQEESVSEIGETIIAIAWSGGRVDIGIEVEKPEPRWVSSRDPVTSAPVIPIIESILLPFPQGNPEDLTSNAPTFHRDPLYTDVFYVQHSFAIDSINVRHWLGQVASDTDELAGSEVVRRVESAGSPLRPMVGMVNFCNITLGYGLLGLASSGQLASIELDLRIADSELAAPATTHQKAPQTGGFAPNEADSQSLLLAKPIDYDRLISSIRQPTQPYNPIKTLRAKLSDSSNPLTTITPPHLRALGEVSSQVQQRSSSISTASQTIESRLDLAVQELQRQIRLLRDCQKRIEVLKTASIVSRADGLLRNQEELASRLEGVLGQMKEEYRPQIGDVERKWFDELERLRQRVRGGGVVGGKALATRAQVLHEQLSAIKPMLRDPAPAAAVEQPQSPLPRYGSRQLKPLEAALAARSEELRRLMRRMEMLDLRVDTVAGSNGDDREE